MYKENSIIGLLFYLSYFAITPMINFPNTEGYPILTARTPASFVAIMMINNCKNRSKFFPPLTYV
jgi:hypothetical protein